MLGPPSTGGSMAVEKYTSAAFLDKLRMLVLTPKAPRAFPSLPHVRPMRRFCASLGYHGLVSFHAYWQLTGVLGH